MAYRGAPQRRIATWPGRIVAWTGRIVARTRAPLRVVPRVVPQPLRALPITVSQAPSGRIIGARHRIAARERASLCRVVGTVPSCLAPWSQYTLVYCDTMPSLSSSNSHNTISVLRYNSAAQLPLSHNTLQILQYNQPTKLYCNTISSQANRLLLLYNECPAIQFSAYLQYTFTPLAATKSQYNTLYCNTI